MKPKEVIKATKVMNEYLRDYEYTVAWHLAHVIDRVMDRKQEATLEDDIDSVARQNLNLTDLDVISDGLLPDVEDSIFRVQA